jgi:hypothetical protein
MKARWSGVVFVVLVLVGGGCASDEGAPSGTGENPKKSPASEEPAPVAPLVGQWKRVTRCGEFVANLKQAGLGDLVPQSLSGNGLVSGSPAKLAKKPDICAGARPRVHSHFFSQYGEFGSLNWNEQPVDDGSYKIINDHTFVLGGHLTFHYRIHGDAIMFDPVIPRNCSSKKCRGEAAYMVAVAFPGEKWKRVKCKAINCG